MLEKNLRTRFPAIQAFQISPAGFQPPDKEYEKLVHGLETVTTGYLIV